jgi:PAS domain S-box-containing protein
MPIFRRMEARSAGLQRPIALKLRLCMAAVLLVVGLAISAEAINKVFLSLYERRGAALTLAQTISNVADREVAGAIARLETLSVLPSLQEEEFAALHRQMVVTPQPEGHWFLLYDEAGQVILNTLQPFGALLPGVYQGRSDAQEAALRFLSHGPASGVSQVRWSPRRRDFTVGAQVRVITPSGRRYGIMEMIPGDRLASILASHSPSPGWTLGLADREGRIIASQPASDLDVVRTGTEREGTFLVASGWIDSQRMAFHRSTLTDWSAVIRFTETDPVLISAVYIVGISVFMLALARVMDNTLQKWRADIVRPVLSLETALQFASLHRSDAEARLAGFWDHAEDGMFIADADRRGSVSLAATNSTFWRIAQRHEHAEAGQMKDLLARDADSLNAQVLRCAWVGGSHTFIQHFGDDADIRQCEVRLTAADSDAAHKGLSANASCRIFGIVRDVTQTMRSEAALAESRSQLRQARAVAGIVTWRWTSGAGDLEWLDKAPDLLKSGAAIRSVHPGDRERMLRELNHALRTGAAVNFEIRMRDATGATRFHVGSGGIVHQAGGAFLTGVLVDITERRNAEEVRNQALDLFSRIAEATSSVLYIRDIDEQRLIYLNQRISAISGYEAETLSEMATEGLRFLVHPADIEQFDRTAASAAQLAEGAEVTQVFRLRHRDGHWRWLQTSETVFARNKAGGVTQLLGNLQDVTEAREAKQGLRNISAQLLNAQDQERRRIARDLHDSTAQLLAAASMATARLQALLADTPERADVEIRRLEDLIQQSQREVRTVSYLLHPPLLDDVGFKAALDWYTGGLAKQSGIAIHVDVTDNLSESRPPRDVEIALFRVVQEALSNAIRHAACTTVWITLQADGACTLRLTVRDDGKGMRGEVSMNPAHGRAITEFGVGIFGMSERIRQLNGCLTIQDAETGGTVVSATLRPQA